MEEQTLSLPDILFRAQQEQQKEVTGVQEGGGNNTEWWTVCHSCFLQ